MPVGVLLEESCGLNYGEIVSGTADKLKTDGEILFGETTRDRECRQAADIADAAQRIGERETGLEIHFEERSRNRL